MFDTAVTRVRPIIGRYIALLLIASGLFLSAHAVKAPCLTPVMGWNSYDCWNYGVTESQFMQNAHYLANLKQYGWQYCVVDFIWWIPVSCAGCGNQSGDWNKGNMDQYGRFLPDSGRFPSSKGNKGFKPLADSVHNLGLKFGIHLMRGVPRMATAAHRNCSIYNSTYTCDQAADQSSTCPWLDWMYGAQNNAAGQAYLNSILSLYNSWNVDFIKVDDLSAATYHTAEVVMYANAIASVSREVAFSTSPGATPLSDASHVMQYANQWRLVNDLWDINWTDFTNALQVAESWRNTLVNGQIIAGPGHWPDVDMLPFGHLSLDGPNGNPRYSLSNRTKGEHKVLYFLFCISNNPLQWGGNLPDNSNDRLYDSLMMCSEAIFINQHGMRGRVLKSYTTNTPVWVSTHPTDTTTKYLYYANTSGSSQSISVVLNTIGFPATQAVPVHNVWTKASLGNVTGTFTQTIASHDASLFTLGNGTPTAIAPAARIEKPVQPAGEKVFFTTSNRCVIPASFAGKNVRVATYGLGGKLLNSIITRDRAVKLYKGDTYAEKVGIVKITEIR